MDFFTHNKYLASLLRWYLQSLNILSRHLGLQHSFDIRRTWIDSCTLAEWHLDDAGGIHVDRDIKDLYQLQLGECSRNCFTYIAIVQSIFIQGVIQKGLCSHANICVISSYHNLGTGFYQDFEAATPNGPVLCEFCKFDSRGSVHGGRTTAQQHQSHSRP